MCCCCCSVTQLGPTFCDPVDCSTPGLPVPHHLLEFAQVHVHCISDVQPSHPLTPSSTSAVNLSQHQGLFQRVVCSHRWPKYWSFSFSISPSNKYSGLISFRIDLFDLFWSPCSPRDSQVFSSTTVRRHHQFYGALPSLWSSAHNHTWLLGRPYPRLYGPLSA